MIAENSYAEPALAHIMKGSEFSPVVEVEVDASVSPENVDSASASLTPAVLPTSESAPEPVSGPVDAVAPLDAPGPPVSFDVSAAPVSEFESDAEIRAASSEQEAARDTKRTFAKALMANPAIPHPPHA